MNDNDLADLHALLVKTSRTFALTIPLLPEPTRTEVGVAYLLFRIIDTFEDATGWPSGQKVDALGEFVRLLDGDARAAAAPAGRWLERPPVDNAAYLELIAATPRVLAWYQQLGPAARAEMSKHLARSARGMGEFVSRADGSGVLRLESVDDLRDYCYVVAGIVGEMLTELFLLGRPELGAAAGELRSRAVRFGEALQLVNILKDAGGDAIEGRVYLPRKVPLAEVFALARADLKAAGEYTELLRTTGGDRGLVAFNALNSRLAIATLRLLRDKGLGAKLTRVQVTSIAAEVVRAVETGAPLFDIAGLEQPAR
jgi:farnesyl-diphosphate farnesyltransferase